MPQSGPVAQLVRAARSPILRNRLPRRSYMTRSHISENPALAQDMSWTAVGHEFESRRAHFLLLRKCALRFGVRAKIATALRAVALAGPTLSSLGCPPFRAAARNLYSCFATVRLVGPTLSSLGCPPFRPSDEIATALRAVALVGPISLCSMFPTFAAWAAKSRQPFGWRSSGPSLFLDLAFATAFAFY